MRRTLYCLLLASLLTAQLAAPLLHAHSGGLSEAGSIHVHPDLPVGSGDATRAYGGTPRASADCQPEVSIVLTVGEGRSNENRPVTADGAADALIVAVPGVEFLDAPLRFRPIDNPLPRHFRLAHPPDPRGPPAPV